MKVEVAQITTDPGCIEKNTQKIIASIKRAKQDQADLVVFPELAIPGYASMDLFLYSDYIKKNKTALQQIALETSGITAIVGFVDQDESIIGPDGTPLRYNSAAILQNGELIGVEDKTLIPDYDVFDERRYFESARERRVYECSGIKVGIETCEDLWDPNYPIKVSEDLVKKGAQILINLSASPFYVDKRQVREKLIRSVVKKYQVPFIYANLVGSQDGYDGQLVFDGQSLVYDATGELIAQGKAFEEDQFLVDLKNPKALEPVYLPPIEQLYKALSLGGKEYFRRSGFNKAVIGLSGGIDSAVVACLVAEAIGPENVTGISMPSTFSSQGSIDDAEQLAQNLGINFKIVPIGDIHNAFLNSFTPIFPEGSKDLTNQNLQARIRGTILMTYSNETGSLLASTGNKTEMALGYCTLYGDMNGGLALISDVSKLQVYELARYINRQAKMDKIPQSTVQKPPSAELTSNQTDENSLGADYQLISPIVDALVEKRATIEELTKLYPASLVEKFWQLISQNEYKRRQSPPGVKVRPLTFGIGRRIPIAHNFRA